MELVLGVSVHGPVAHLAVANRPAPGQPPINQVVALPLKATEPSKIANEIAGVVVATRTVHALKGHKLVAVGLCWADEAASTLVRVQLGRVGLSSVTAIDPTTAAAAFVRGLPDNADRPSGLLLLADGTATLSTLDGETTETVGTAPLGDDAVAACATLIAQLPADTVDTVYLVGDNADVVAKADSLREGASVTLVVPEQPDFVVARGAAFAAPVVQTPAPAQDPNAATAALLAAIGQRSQAAPTTKRRQRAPMSFAEVDIAAGPPKYSDSVVRLLRASAPAPAAVEAAKPATVAAAAAPKAAEAETVKVKTVAAKAAAPKVTEAETVKVKTVAADGKAASRVSEPTVMQRTIAPKKALRRLPELSTLDTADDDTRKTQSPRRGRRSGVLVGSALAGLVVAGAAAIAITAATGVDPTAEQSPSDSAQQSADEPAAASELNQQSGPAPLLVAPPAGVEAPVPGVAVDPVLPEMLPVPEVLPAPEVLPVSEVLPVPEVLPEAGVEPALTPDAVPEVPVAEVPVATVPEAVPGAVEGVAPEVLPETQHMPGAPGVVAPEAVPPAVTAPGVQGATPEAVAPAPYVPPAEGPQPLPRVEDVAPVPHLP